MFRGATARTVISLLAAALLTLQFFAPSASFASAHTARHIEAKTEPRNKPRAEALRDEHVTCGDDGRSEHPSSPCVSATGIASSTRVPNCPSARRSPWTPPLRTNRKRASRLSIKHPDR